MPSCNCCTTYSAPDLMDGGVTAALIEKEVAGSYTRTDEVGGPLDESVEFWQARWKEAADRADARDTAAHLWKETARESIVRGRVHVGAVKTMAENLRVAMAQHDDALAFAAEQIAEAQAEATAAVTAKEKAEQERDEARREAREWQRDALNEVQNHRIVRNELDRLRAEQPRPLTADDITDEARKRAADAWWTWKANGAASISGLVDAILAAALTEPTPEPTDTEKLADVLRRFPGRLAGIRDIADHLASEGVRVTGAGS